MAKTAYTKEFLENIHKGLLEEKKRLEIELAKFTTKNVHISDDYDSKFPSYGDKEDENANEVADYAANLTLEDTLEKTLRDVNQSLDRIKKGTYGVCKYCKKEIEIKRLEARPTSSACVACKKAIVQEL